MRAVDLGVAGTSARRNEAERLGPGVSDWTRAGFPW